MIYKINIKELNINKLLQEIEKVSDIKWINGKSPTEYIPNNNYLTIEDNGLSISYTLRKDEILCLTIQDFVNKCKKIVPKKKKGFNMIDKIKEQYKKHEDILFPLLVIWALDYFFNDGRFQHKITSVVENILDKVTSKFTKDINTKELPSGDK